MIGGIIVKSSLHMQKKFYEKGFLKHKGDYSFSVGGEEFL